MATDRAGGHSLRRSLVPRYSLSLRDVEEFLRERGLAADHTTMWRWVQRYGPELELRIRRHLKATNRCGALTRPTLRSKAAGGICIGQSIRRARRSISCC